MNHDYETEFTPGHRSGDALNAFEKELTDLLEGAGIVEFGLDGSRAYRITVRREQADTAREVLRRSKPQKWWSGAGLLKLEKNRLSLRPVRFQPKPGSP